MGIIIAGGAAIQGTLSVLGVTKTAFIFGVKAQQAFAIGLLAFDFTALVIAPITGMEIEVIGWNDQEPFKPAEPQVNSTHPYLKKWKQRRNYFKFP